MSAFSTDISKFKKSNKAFAVTYFHTYFLLQQRVSRLEPIT